MAGLLTTGTTGEILFGEIVFGVIDFGDITLTGILTTIIGFGIEGFMVIVFGEILGIIDSGIIEITDMEEELPTTILTAEEMH